VLSIRFLYLVYDNELGHIVRTDRSSDRIAGRERVGMGILVARWLRQGGVADPAVRVFFDRFYTFVNTHLQRSDGYVSPLASDSPRLCQPRPAHAAARPALCQAPDRQSAAGGPDLDIGVDACIAAGGHAVAV
jgi:hypothetical protein